MRRKTLIITLLVVVLFLIPLLPTSNELGYSEEFIREFGETLPDDTLYLPDLPFGLSVDGDESTSSITSWSETLSSDTGLDPDSDTNGDFSVSEWGTAESLTDDTPFDPDSDTNGDFSKSEWGSGESLADDVLFYPDAFNNGTYLATSSSSAGPDSSTGAYTDTHSDTMTDYDGIEDSSGTAYVILNFTLPYPSSFESFDYAINAAGANDDDDANLWVYNWTADDWVLLDAVATGVYGWHNDTGLADPDYSGNGQISIMVNSTDADSDAIAGIAVAHLTIYVMYLGDSGYVAGVSTLAYWGVGGPDSQENDYTYTWSSIVDEIIGHETTSGTSHVMLNFTLPSDTVLDSFDYNIHAAGANDDDEANLWVYDWDADDWVLIVNLPTMGIGTWYNGTGISDSSYSDGSQISIMVNSTDADNPSQCEIAIAELIIFAEGPAHSDHYAEGFADVSEWVVWDTEAEATESITTDGDLGAFSFEGDAGTDNDIFYMNSISIPEGEWEYVEMRYYFNSSAATLYRLFLMDEDFVSGYVGRISFTMGEPTTWMTQRWYKTDGEIFDAFEGNIESLVFYLRTTTDVDVIMYVDYLRVGPAEEMGLQHDGSTIEGITLETDADWTSNVTSDGDILSYSAQKTGGVDQYLDITFGPDPSTSTEADIETDYYPYIEIRYRVTSAVNMTIEMVTYYDSHRIGNTPLTSGSWFTARFNHKEGGAVAATIYGILFYAKSDTAGQNGYIVFELDWVKMYSMINWTYTDPNAGVADTSSVVSYDDSEEAIVMQFDLTNGENRFHTITRNTSINYDYVDMVLLLTVKASSNTTLRLKPLTHDGTLHSGPEYGLFDDWITIAWSTDATAQLDFIYLEFNDWTNAADGGIESIYIKDNITLRPSWYDATEESGTYGESFADVSDWDYYLGSGLTSDGDLGIQEESTHPSNFYAVTWDAISEPDKKFYVEMRYRFNTSITNSRIYLQSLDGGIGDACYTPILSSDGNWHTLRLYGELFSSIEVGGVESISISTSSLSNDWKLEIDYLRIGPAEVMGYQNDFSNVNPDLYNAMSESFSDGDVLYFSGTGGSYAYLKIDALDVDVSIYPFMEIRWKAEIGQDIRFVAKDEDGVSTSYFYYGIETGDWVIDRFNMQEVMTGDELDEMDIYDQAGASQEFWVDYIKFYNMINWTYLGGAGNTGNNVMYYDSDESAIVVELKLSTNADNLYFQTENISIGYDISDMVVLLTVKASANTSLRVRPRVYYSGGNNYQTYYVYDSYQTISMGISSNAAGMTILGEFYAYDWSTASPASGTVQLYIMDNITIRPSWYDATGETGTFSESFASIPSSEWDEDGFEAGDSKSTDGDIMTVIFTYDAGGIIDRTHHQITPSFTDYENLYVEMRYYFNSTDSDNFYLYFWDGAGRTGNSAWAGLAEATTWTTVKLRISEDFTSWDLDNITCVDLRFQASVDKTVEFYIDYLRIAPIDESGWQFDGSTVIEAETWSNAYGFSDGDNLEVGTFSSQGDFRIDIHTVDFDDYPFLEIGFVSSTDDIAIDLRGLDGSGTYILLTDSWFTPTSNTVYRYNIIGAGLDEYDSGLRVYFYTRGTTVIDYFGFYSIANLTISDLDDEPTTNVAYVENNRLIVSEAGDYIRFTYDVTISISSATYSVWNASLSSGAGGFRFRELASTGIYHDMGETRGGIVSTTLSLFEFLAYTGLELGSIKFIEDGTAPTVVRTRANPPEPVDDEEVTIGSVVTDAIEVYSVKFNAITSPAGFNDVDYSATELTDNFWTYTFSSGDLPSGYYAFKVIASDGANVNGLTTEQEFVDFTVRKGEIDVDTITLFGAGEDFTYMEWSFELNRDCTFVIREWSENEAAADTHSGSVGAGTPNIAWIKLDTADKYVNFTVTFTNGSLTYLFTSSYQVAQAALAISYRGWGYSQTKVTFSAQSNKDGTYTVYLDNVQEDTGAFSSGSIYLNWTRTQSTTPSDVDAAIKFTDGLSTVWINNTYVEYSVDALTIAVFDVDWLQGNVTTVMTTTSWGNTTIDIYLNGSQVVTNHAEGLFNFTRSSNTGVFNFTIFFDGGSDSITYTAWVNVTETGASYDYSTTSGGSISYPFIEGDTHEGDTIEGIDPELVRDFVIVIVAGMMLAAFLSGIYVWWEKRKEKRADFRAQLGS